MTDSDSRPPTSGRYAGKVVLVTGTSDRGIGGAIAERLAGEGARLSMLSLEEPLRLRKKLAKKGSESIWRRCDIRLQDQIDQAVGATLKAFGALDILVNNAGVETAASLVDFDDADWLSMLETNLTGTIRLTKAVLPHLTSPHGVIVNISSALSLGGCPGFNVYSASKGGMNGLTQSLAWELAPKKQRVVGVAPALVHTPMIHKHVQHLSEQAEAKIASCHPLGVGLPRDVAAAVAFLASDEARWITGVTLPMGYVPMYPLPTEQFLG
jgi:NAD(P)-dependent dehydrogenase (short-subunit alcohol dehydrogenase family)